MCPSEQYQQFCKNEFAEIRGKLDKIDESIRGNGKPGIQFRLGRLESAETIRSRLLWAITVATVTLAAGALWKLFFGA